jgi:hypothetical protein
LNDKLLNQSQRQGKDMQKIGKSLRRFLKKAPSNNTLINKLKGQEDY